MQSSLWKLGALLAVIGGGFLVLLKAQNDMTSQEAPPEAFNELAAIDELSELGEPAPPDQAEPRMLAASSVAGATPVDIDRSTSIMPPSEAVTRTAEVDSAATSTDPATDEEVVNPFAAFTAAAPPATESDVPLAGNSEPAAEDVMPPEDGTTPNPFATLVDSFSRSGEDEIADSVADAKASAAAQIDEVHAAATETVDQMEDAAGQVVADVQETIEGGQDLDEVADSLVAAANEFNPFGPVEDSSSEPTPAEPATEKTTPLEPTLAESEDVLPTLAELSPAEPTLADPVLPEPTLAEPEPAAPSPTMDVAEADFSTKQYEPTSLTALPPRDSEPALVAPPLEDADTLLPNPTEAPADELLADETDVDNQIAQVSGEERAGGASDPNPFLVFPGSNESDQPAPQQNPTPQPMQFPGSEPEPSVPTPSGRAWVGDTPQAANRDERKLHPDGSVEMTILPRTDEGSVAASPPPSQQDVNPFDPGPERSTAPQPRPSVENPAAQPQLPDPGLSFSKGPIQPAAATEPQKLPENSGFSQADFVGVGTISADTPSTPQQAQLTIEKKAPSDAALGQELIYSILVKNVGRSPAKNVVVEDLVPKGTELQGTDPQAQMTPEKKLVWQLGSMSPGTQRTIRIKVIPTEAGQIGSVATVSFEAAVASRTTITAPQLRLALNGPQEVRVGEAAPYKFVLTNTGTADASNVFVRSILPAGFEHPAAQQRNGVTDIEYEVGTLPRGETREVELTLLAVSEGQFQNHAILTADGNVNVESQQAVNIISSRLKIHREGPANRVVGSEARFVNTVSNQSSQPLQGVTVTETLPAGAKFVSASDGGYYDAQRRSVTWRLNTFAPNDSRRLQLVVTAEQPGQLESKITAVNQQGDHAEASSTLRVAGYSSLTIDVSNPARAIPVGEEVALRLKVRNGGSAAAKGVETRIQLPSELKFVSAHGPVRYAQDGQTIAFEPIDRIDIQGEQTFDIILAAASESTDARVVVQLTSSELTKPLSEDESVVIYADSP